jgi:phosphonatase-like hydrolase
VTGRCQLIVLDLAGTTVKDDGRVALAFEGALRDQGVDLTPQELANVRGMSKRDAIRRLMPDGADHERRTETAYAAFVALLTDAYQRHPVDPIDGAETAIRDLRSRGVRVALNTGFDRVVTDLLLSRLGWDRDLVDAVVCGDDVARGRPAPDLIVRAMAATGTADASVVANVGDTTMDLEAGQAAGVRWNVGVTSGAHDRARLERAPHTHLIASVADLPLQAFLRWT